MGYCLVFNPEPGHPEKSYAIYVSGRWGALTMDDMNFLWDMSIFTKTQFYEAIKTQKNELGKPDPEFQQIADKLKAFKRRRSLAQKKPKLKQV